LRTEVSRYIIIGFFDANDGKDKNLHKTNNCTKDLLESECICMQQILKEIKTLCGKKTKPQKFGAHGC